MARSIIVAVVIVAVALLGHGGGMPRAAVTPVAAAGDCCDSPGDCGRTQRAVLKCALNCAFLPVVLAADAAGAFPQFVAARPTFPKVESLASADTLPPFRPPRPSILV